MADLKMPEINTVVLAGNLTRDPVFRKTTNGNSLVTFTVASNRRYRDSANQWQEDVCFIGVIARNKLADSCIKHLKQGYAVLIEGELQSRNWKIDEDHSHRIVEVKARRIQFLNKLGVKPNDGESAPEKETESDTVGTPDDSGKYLVSSEGSADNRSDPSDS
jgi:single-strand DNA-binding protein